MRNSLAAAVPDDASEESSAASAGRKQGAGWHCWLALAGLVLGAAASTAADADGSRAEDLRRCLSDFAGIVWQWPYAPMLKADNCESPAGSYLSDKPANGHSTLHLSERASLEEIGSGPDRSIPIMVSQNAVFLHFDALFKRSGFEVIELRKHDPPFVYVSHARYVRRTATGDAVLSYDLGEDHDKSWIITLDRPPGGNGTKAAGP